MLKIARTIDELEREIKKLDCTSWKTYMLSELYKLQAIIQEMQEQDNYHKMIMKIEQGKFWEELPESIR